ncbi:MAG TPA: hypothetical protein VGL47_42490 [Amycolatopsis sp.]|uniref:Uncharacterized protein n=1 Tax=Amycolatopsis nalaikhensis TaxID=715472 RepID=A0ABY8Y1Y1_9PSEU|nr:hypothetical protein [Amycolatopsis sp. 2-2]WIV61877.1 hypothetical protein QP939_26335 [Amycolatopsis sp. 2-2]
MRQVGNAVPELRAVEWVTHHDEAHGHLLVHGRTIDEIVALAKTAVGAGQTRLKIHLGWWRTEPCRRRPTLASSNHPRWHYRPAAATDAGAWRGAEVRLTLRLPASGRA